MNFVIISTMNFDEELSAKYYAEKLAESGHKVLYVNQQVGYEHIFLKKIKCTKQNSLEKINSNLFVYTPFNIFSFHNMSIALNYIEQFLFSISLKNIIKKIGFNKFNLLIYQHNCEPLIKFLKPYKSFYIVIDEFVEIASGHRKKIIFLLEKKLILTSDFVLVASKTVLNRILKLREKNVFSFPSAFDSDIFKTDGITPKQFNKKNIGILSTFDDRIDYELIKYLVENLKEYSFYFISRDVNQYLKFFQHYHNVKIVGKISRKKVVEYMNNIPIFLMPYLVNNLTNSISSLKLIEALAMNKIIISTPIKNSLELKKFIFLEKNKEMWLNIIKKFDVNEKKRVDLKDFLNENSLKARIEFLFKLIKYK